MLAVARAACLVDTALYWRQGREEAIPFDDDAFDVVLCPTELDWRRGRILEGADLVADLARQLTDGGNLLGGTRYIRSRTRVVN